MIIRYEDYLVELFIYDSQWILIGREYEENYIYESIRCIIKEAGNGVEEFFLFSTGS